jgi:UDP-N-acetylglucosamine 2-epimerase (non-hydrolysing)
MRFLCVVGTRPEAIKLAPVILELRRHAQVITLCSGQHTDIVREPLDWFGISSDEWIALPPDCDTLAKSAGAMMAPMEKAILAHRPDVIVAQGDTTTVLVTALTAFYLGIPFAHVEAGLRTGDFRAPFPEEANRVIATRLATWHFCPTPRAVAVLRAEGIDEKRIFMTGNTVIDALRLTLDKIDINSDEGGSRRILLTAHRRENQGQRMEGICRAVAMLVSEFDDIEFVIPVHRNPAVRQSFETLLACRDRVHLLPPLSYPEIVAEMARAHLILTDSGGIQEEAPFLKKPVLVLRDVTERPEAVELGVVRLVGADTGTVAAAVRNLLTDRALYARMASGGSPYGDGYAAERIAQAFGFSSVTSQPLPQLGRR